MKIDFLVVGQGLAGTIIAQTLLGKGCSVLVVDEFREQTASKVAAGLLNPVAGKRVSLSWKAAELVPAAHSFYTSLELFLGKKFFYPLPLIRLFSTLEDQNTWLAKSADPQMSPFLDENWDECMHTDINSALGGIKVSHAAYVNMREMLGGYRDYLQQNNLLLSEPFDYTLLEITDNGVRYKQTEAGAVIFCEGYRVAQNPYFNWLPIVPTKGEVIDFTTENTHLSCLYNKAVYMVPNGANGLRVGATYNWRTPDEIPTPEGLAELTEKATDMVTVPLKKAAHYAGIRPAVRDRKPILGRHPHHKQLVTFNGMGSKGVMMAPFFANQLADSLLFNHQVYREADISRYYSLLPATNP